MVGLWRVGGGGIVASGNWWDCGKQEVVGLSSTRALATSNLKMSKKVMIAPVIAKYLVFQSESHRFFGRDLKSRGPKSHIKVKWHIKELSAMAVSVMSCIALHLQLVTIHNISEKCFKGSKTTYINI